MLIVLIAFTVLLLIGMPVAFAIGISGVLFFLQHPELPVTIPIQLTVTETQNFALLAVPLFILAGNFLNNSGITENLLKLATVLTGRMYGSLAQTSIALSTLMSGVTGSSIADAAMNARILGLQMLKRGFSRGYAAGRDLLRLAARADHPAGHRLHPLRHGRTGLDRPAVRGRHHPGPDAVGRARDRDLDHGAQARLQAGARDARDREGDRARLLGRHLGDPVSRSSCCSGCATASSRRPRSAPSR